MLLSEPSGPPGMSGPVISAFEAFHLSFSKMAQNSYNGAFKDMTSDAFRIFSMWDTLKRFFCGDRKWYNPPCNFFLGVRARWAMVLIAARQNCEDDFVKATFENNNFQKMWLKKCGNGRMATAYPSFETSAFAFSEKYHIKDDQMHFESQKCSQS